MTFKQLAHIGLASWSYDDCKYILTGCVKLHVRVAKYVLKKKFKTP